MPGRKKVTKPKSKAQARMFGAAAAGAKTKASGLSRAEARRKMGGVKMKSLPARKKKGSY